jgi:hypothetical protein
MPGIARQFEPQITRSGGAPSRYRFTVRCSDCANAETYEASRPTSNDAVKAYFKDRGWLLGRAASFDLCSACLARPRHAQETQRTGQPREVKVLDKRHRDTADILARHLGKPEDLAAKVFRPKEAKPIQSPAPEAPLPTQYTPAFSPEIEPILSGMAADLKDLRSAVEFVADQVSQLVALGSRQIEALAQLPPALTQLAEGFSDGLRQVADAIQAGPPLLHPVADQAYTAKPDTDTTQTQTADAELAPVAEPAVPEPPRPIKGRRRNRDETVASEPANIVVKSIADAKGMNRFYTSIRLPRQLWDHAGFRPEDRLLLEWNGEALSITRAADGGVKPKSIGSRSVVLQSWKLGNLSFDSSEVLSVKGSQCLQAKP